MGPTYKVWLLQGYVWTLLDETSYSWLAEVEVHNMKAFGHDVMYEIVWL